MSTVHIETTVTVVPDSGDATTAKLGATIAERDNPGDLFAPAISTSITRHAMSIHDAVATNLTALAGAEG